MSNHSLISTSLSLICFYFMCMNICPHICMFTTCVPGPQGGQMKVLDLLELGLLEVMSHYMGDGKQTHVH